VNVRPSRTGTRDESTLTQDSDDEAFFDAEEEGADENGARKKPRGVFGAFVTNVKKIGGFFRSNTATHAHMGDDNKFVYNQRLGRWVLEGEEDDASTGGEVEAHQPLVSKRGRLSSHNGKDDHVLEGVYDDYDMDEYNNPVKFDPPHYSSQNSFCFIFKLPLSLYIRSGSDSHYIYVPTSSFHLNAFSLSTPSVFLYPNSYWIFQASDCYALGGCASGVRRSVPSVVCIPERDEP
jgi:hypothetical protein